ncbi:glycosyltransferase family protein [Candidatus Symbiobacter mobilis]|uniref:Spore protein YkvP/CgeB glycosyl transferase-like domain-containing protein n=1 Tax=Candidatus Symbiobacter mobilis CR TaxID=946483 RepID=U5N9Z8_9BURK|nr:class I SAM-dependent methyltransferase [Candidatus Symbiobacter mobilis]AGX88145.1 hypothetical protein Cenrod_2074 [Candidatus Symbiobacter mobilis CR]
MNICIVETIKDFQTHFGLAFDGVLLETDLDVVEVDTDANGRARRDAEVLCTLAANAEGDVLELGTSHGRGTYKLATNLQQGYQCHTVNILPEQENSTSGKLITHLLTKDEIGSYYRERGITNIVQYYGNTAQWQLPSGLQNFSMVFIDAAHDEENVYLDSKLVWDRIKPGGFMVWHDFSPLNLHFDWIVASMKGAERFIREFQLEKVEIVNLRHSWCGVLRKPEVPQVAAKDHKEILLNSTYSTTNYHAAQCIVKCADMRALNYAIVYPAYSLDRVAEECQLASNLNQLGYNVEAIGIPCHGAWWPFPMLDRKWKTKSADLMSRYGILEDKLEDKDVLIAAGGSMLHPDFIRSLSTFNVFYCADDPESSEYLSKPVAASFDFSFVANIACLPDYLKWGVKRVAWLPLPVLTSELDSSIKKESILNTGRCFDIVMCCEQIYGLSDRALRLEQLNKIFPHAILRGKGWPDGYVSIPQLNYLYRNARIGWNLHNSIGPVNSRLMKLPAFGALQICDCRDNLGKIFKLDEEVIGFNTLNECIDATRYYLAHEDERRKIALAGWKRVMSDYIDEQWWMRLLGYIEPYLVSGQKR